MSGNNKLSNRVEYLWFLYSKKSTIVYILLSILVGILSFSLIPMKEYIIINIGDKRRIITFLLLYLILMLFEYLSRQVLVDLSRRIKIKVNKNFQEELLSISKHLTCKDVENHNLQNDLKRYNKLHEDSDTMLASYSSRIINYVKFFGILIIIIRTRPLFLAIYLILILILGLAKSKQSQITFGFWKRYMDNVAKANHFSKIQINREYAAERKIYSSLDFINSKFTDYFDIAKKENQKAGRKRALFDVLAEFIGITILLISFLVWIPLLISRQISLGRFFILIEASISLQYILSEELSRESQIQEYVNTQKEYCSYKSEMLMKKDQIDYKLSRKYYNKISSLNNFDIRFDNVSFAYLEGEEVIKNFSFTFKTNKNYVIVGENGAGKSTLSKLMMGLYTDYKGVITIGGVDIKKLGQEHLSLLINMMYQTPVKLPLTIGENIALKDVSQNDFASIDNAIYDEELNNKIKKMPRGWNTYVGDLEKDGIDLSGGQWQKIFMGRASYTYSPILILDEPAGSLDPISELDLYKRLEKHMKSKLNIIISHRLGVVKLADEILLLAGGELTESGKHQELMDRGGRYYELYMSQKSLYKRADESFV